MAIPYAYLYVQYIRAGLSTKAKCDVKIGYVFLFLFIFFSFKHNVLSISDENKRSRRRVMRWGQENHNKRTIAKKIMYCKLGIIKNFKFVSWLKYLITYSNLHSKYLTLYHCILHTLTFIKSNIRNHQVVNNKISKIFLKKIA